MAGSGGRGAGEVEGREDMWIVITLKRRVRRMQRALDFGHAIQLLMPERWRRQAEIRRVMRNGIATTAPR
jgi:hypothetical protein